MKDDYVQMQRESERTSEAWNDPNAIMNQNPEIDLEEIDS